MGKKLSKVQMQQAFQVMQNGFAPFEGTVESISLARVNPHRDVWTYEM